MQHNQYNIKLTRCGMCISYYCCYYYYVRQNEIQAPAQLSCGCWFCYCLGYCCWYLQPLQRSFAERHTTINTAKSQISTAAVNHRSPTAAGGPGSHSWWLFFGAADCHGQRRGEYSAVTALLCKARELMATPTHPHRVAGKFVSLDSIADSNSLK